MVSVLSEREGVMLLVFERHSECFLFTTLHACSVPACSPGLDLRVIYKSWLVARAVSYM